MNKSVHGDAVIGRAFRVSLQVLMAGAMAAAGLWYLTRGDPAPAVIVSTPVAGPIQGPPPAVAPPAVTFTDITTQAGIAFMPVNGARGDKLLPETLGQGAAFFDYDNDGDPDLLLVNGRYWPDDPRAATQQPRLVLYRNDGGRFTDISSSAGLAVSLYGMGVAVGDYDADGWTDVFITALGPNRLFHNRRGMFEEVTAQAGVAGADEAWSTAAAFFDYDRDGDQDLFVGNYVAWSKAMDLALDFQLTGIGRAYGPPTQFQGTQPYLYRNEGNGRFTEVSAAAGIQVIHPTTQAPVAKTLAAMPLDVDGDGWLDIVVANDTVRNFLYHNQGDGRFREVGAQWGLAYDRFGAATGAMGLDAAHYRNDAALGVVVGNFANEMSSLYVSYGLGTPFTDEAIVDGIGPATRRALTFGVVFLDYDLDGRLDLLQVNGHLENAINEVQASQHYRQPPQLFWNCGDPCPMTFVEAPSPSLGDLAEPLVGRAVSYADIDGDGDLDLLLTQVGGPPRLYRNDQQLGHHWLRLRFPSARIGARVELRAGGLTQVRDLMPTRGYLSQVESTVTFGLGEARSIDRLRIIRPDGSVRTLENVPVNSTVDMD